MSFNPEVKASHPAVFFNDIPVACCSTHKHFGMYFDEKLNCPSYTWPS